MDKRYRDTPENFSEIQSYVITDKEQIVRNIILSEKCYFYDTCAIRNHMQCAGRIRLFEYLKKNSGIVIITRCILMELCSDDGCLWEEQVEYIKELSEHKIPVLVLYEEDIFDIMRAFCADISRINSWLSFAVRCAKGKTGKMEAALRADAKLREELIANPGSKDSALAKKFFSEVRSLKTSKDNMGEELLAVCVHWLSHMRSLNDYKYVILTDDKKAVPTMGKVIKNTREHLGSKSVAVVTTAKLCELMYKAGVVEDASQIIALFSEEARGKDLKVYCSEEFELYPTEKGMSVRDFSQKVIEEKMKVYF